MTDVTPGADRDQVVRTPLSPVPPPLALRRIAAVSAGTGALLLALGGRYGYHRDELYYRAAGDHLAWDTTTSRRLSSFRPAPRPRSSGTRRPRCVPPPPSRSP
ncbi:hypothetical protein [Streptomyces sp. NPDC005181]|uniref:hypothetical protein n=1 Tax=Streptomyces sp. NPDC005181 TaxID=3156869 RepID=UPI0033A7047D